MRKPVIAPLSEAGAPRRSVDILEQVGKALGWVPNLFKTAAHSPVALQSLWMQSESAPRTQLPMRLREALALRIADLNSCEYCLAAHTAIVKQVGVDDAEAAGFRVGVSSDTKEQAVLALAAKIVKDRGQNAGFVVDAARQVGVTDAQIIEVIALIAYHTFTNYLSSVANIEVDFPNAKQDRIRKDDDAT